MKKIVTLRPKMCSYLTDDDIVDKKPKSTKNVIKEEIKCENYKKCLENNKFILRTRHFFRSDVHKIFTKK